MQRHRHVPALLGIATSACAMAQAPQLLPLGRPGPNAIVQAVGGVSADGSTVVGMKYTTGSGNRAFRWRKGTGFDDPGPSQGLVASWATGVSADGAVIIGATGHAQFGDLEGWVRYGASAGHVGSPPGHDTSSCYGVSSNGVVVAGCGGLQSNPNLYEAAYYTEQGDWVNMGFLSGGISSQARAASANGSVIVGWSHSALAVHREAFRWTAGGGMISLGNLPGGEEAIAEGVSGDGLVVVGSDYVRDAQFNSAETAWRWTPSAGMTSLGFLPGGIASRALATNSDGAVVVGYADDGGVYRAFVWDAQRGVRRVRDALIEQGIGGAIAGVDLTGATCVSPDGRWIAGEGVDQDGLYAGWVARLGSPCFGDTNGDRAINFADLNAVLNDFGASASGLPGDVDADGAVTFADLNAALANFGTTCL